HAFGRDRVEERAFNVGEAGLNQAISRLSQVASQETLPANTAVPSGCTPYASSGTSFTVESGSGYWCAAKATCATVTDIWTIYSVATVGSVTRKFSVQMAANKSVVSSPVSSVWAKGFFVADPTFCTSMVGTATMKISTYIVGNLCLTGTEQIEDQTPASPSLHLYVGGQVRISGNNASVGLKGPPVQPIYQADIVGGCLKDGVPKTCSSQGSSHVYAYSNSSCTGLPD